MCKQRLYIVAICLLLLLGACNGATPTPDTNTPAPTQIALETPTAINTTIPAPTSTLTPIITPVDPTPTQEVNDTLRTVNGNPYLCGDVVRSDIYPTSDGRYQAQPDQYNLILTLGNIGVPPYINYRNAPNGCHHLGIEVTEVNGLFGYETGYTFQPNQCYLGKVTAYVSLNQAVQGIGNLSDASVFARIRIGDRVIPFTAQGFNDWTTPVESIFPFRFNQETFAFFGAGVYIRWATFRGEFELRRFEIIEVPAGYCAGVVAF
ncbi:hypothetical protein KC887_02470 [Candidatus Kaiserbacteria bacterium]|nr:hypothetical protein [Candidatus Kaiserbacteria bacterium]